MFKASICFAQLVKLYLTWTEPLVSYCSNRSVFKGTLHSYQRITLNREI